MTQVQSLTPKQFHAVRSAFARSNPATGDTAAHLAKIIEDARIERVTTIAESEQLPGSLDDQLYTALARCKVSTNQFAMHFGVEWQRRFFAQLDALMNKDDWDSSDTLATDASFTTLIRLLLTMRGQRRPGLGLGNGGRLVAAWTKGTNRLTIECLPDDRVRWIVSQMIEGEPDTAAGDTTLALLPERLAPFNPEKWFADEGSKSPS